MHISDLHAGPYFDLRVAEQLVREANDLRPDLLVISGDMVQRADFANQWRTIAGFIKQLPEPQLIVAGNHDVPLFKVHRRLFSPYTPFRHYITPDLNPVFARPGLLVAGACTAHGLTSDGGVLRPAQIATLENTFAAAPPNTCKVAVWHHPVINPPGTEKDRRISNPRDAVRLLDRCDVELLLCGHAHIAYVGNTLDVIHDLKRGTTICESGTTTSRRGKGRELGKNTYNVIEIEDEVIRIGHRLFLPELGRYEPIAEHLFPRRSAGSYVLPRRQRVVHADK
jgi:3',5'-cyclic AMP phosphodiesterase CpdA